MIFIENVCMNCIIIFATGLITKNKNNFLKTIISSSIGALYAIGKYITNNEIDWKKIKDENVVRILNELLEILEFQSTEWKKYL